MEELMIGKIHDESRQGEAFSSDKTIPLDFSTKSRRLFVVKSE
jgi:hypothetical protein